MEDLRNIIEGINVAARLETADAVYYVVKDHIDYEDVSSSLEAYLNENEELHFLLEPEYDIVRGLVEDYLTRAKNDTSDSDIEQDYRDSVSNF